jgi:hypothetical protein
LSGSFQTSPSFYLDPKNGVSYNVAIQAPQYKVDSLAALQSLPITGSAAAQKTPTERLLRARLAQAPGGGAGQSGVHHARS